MIGERKRVEERERKIGREKEKEREGGDKREKERGEEERKRERVGRHGCAYFLEKSSLNAVTAVLGAG